ncbi:MAG: hypothetical protein IT448_08540 [Phycisphaerales bacterium]|nr:hypothetical protein [Phycisphaerales bacterium]
MKQLHQRLILWKQAGRKRICAALHLGACQPIQLRQKTDQSFQSVAVLILLMLGGLTLLGLGGCQEISGGAARNGTDGASLAAAEPVEAAGSSREQVSLRSELPDGAAPANASASAPTTPGEQTHSMHSTQSTAPAPEAAPPVGQAVPQDAPAAVGVVIQFEIWELLVPYGTVSLNEDFWKRIDEHVVDLETADRLWRNGVRVGEAPVGEWPFFKAIIDGKPVRAQKQIYTARQARTIEIAARGEQLWQDLFYYNVSNQFVGRSYEKCYNFFTLSFEPTPRQPGTVRMVLCPVVRSTRRQLEFVGQREGKTIDYVQAEQLYDVNLKADIALDRFLVVAPSADSRLPTSIGANFLIENGLAERLERVLLFVPRPFALSKEAGQDEQNQAPPSRDQR